jgi:hypothetical protein
MVTKNGIGWIIHYFSEVMVKMVKVLDTAKIIQIKQLDITYNEKYNK